MPQLSGGEYLARALEAYGVECMFLVPTSLSKTLYYAEQLTDIKRIVTHGEKASVYMADGYARATGKVGIVSAQNIGGANLAAGLRDAYLGGSPVLAISGGPYSWSRSRNYYQEIEDFPLFKPLTKFSAQVRDIERLPDLLAQAFRAATSGRPGPVHLEFDGHTGDVIENQTLDVPLPTPDVFRVPRVRSVPAPDDIDAALRLIRGARRPVIVAGGGVRAAAGGRELIAFAERTGIPVATSLNGKDLIPATHPLSIGIPGLYARGSTNHILLEADLVFYIGSKTGSQVTLTWQVPSTDTPIIHLDVEAEDLGRHYPHTTPLLGDAKLGLEALIDAWGDAATPDRRDWLARVETLTRHWREENRELIESDAVPMRPERLSAELTAALPGDALLVADTGHAGMWTGGWVDLTDERQGFIRAAGSLGWGLPAAIGAQLGAPERPVVLFTGDGGFWYHIAEIETAVRWNAPIKVVLNNNRSLNQEIHPYLVAYGGQLHGRHEELWHFHDVDFRSIVEGMGASYLSVTRPSDFGAAMAKAMETPGVVVIEATTEIEALAPKGIATPAGI